MNTRADQDANLNALINAGIREGGGVEFDIVPTQNSANGITSGGMYSTLRDSNIGFVDSTPTSGSGNLVTSGGVFGSMALRYNGHYNNNSVYSDLNNLPLGTITSFTTFSGINNAPPTLSGYGGTIICTNARTDSNTCAIQIFVSSNIDYNSKPHMYFREYWGDGQGWRTDNWQRLVSMYELTSVQTTLETSINTETSKIALKYNGDNGQTVYTDLNDLPVGTVTRFVNFTNIANTPYGSEGLWYGGTILCFEGVSSGVNGKTQILFTPRVATNVQPRAYFRYYWGGDAPGWSDWMKFITEADDYSSLSSFLRIGVVGDSFASGATFMPDDLTHYTEYWSSSWVQQLARINGSVGRNYSHSGVYCKTWLTDSYCKTKLENEDPCDLYYLALGINDSGHTSEQPLGTISDIHDGYPSQNADTFYGNYGRIVELIKSHAPYAHMIFSTMASNIGTKQTFNTAIEEIASHYGIPVIRQYEDGFFISNYYLNHMLNGHPTVQVYGGMAKAIERLTKKCMLTHITYFNDIKPTSIGS